MPHIYVLVGPVRNIQETKYHPKDPLINYPQDYSNSSFFSSLEYSLYAVGESLSEQTIYRSVEA